jgi:hypothetical protein
VGVGASGLQPESRPVQLGLFADTKQVQDRKWEKVDQALDAVSDRFGTRMVIRGAGAVSDRGRK